MNSFTYPNGNVSSFPASVEKICLFYFFGDVRVQESFLITELQLEGALKKNFRILTSKQNSKIFSNIKNSTYS
jgi:hypothetical protein